MLTIRLTIYVLYMRRQSFCAASIVLGLRRNTFPVLNEQGKL